ncbi:MAG: hypothetical protein HYV60_19125 [Planctomycetia bacterium]|nr:hypothetical protein [Planctomycetia bacterium]
MAAKTILVTGDLLTDYHLVRHSLLPRSYGAPVEKTLQFELAGGAWFLHDMVQLGLCDLLATDSCTLLGPQRDRLRKSAPVGSAHSVWSEFPRKKNDKEQVWRIADFLGSGTSVNIAEAKPVAFQGADINTELRAAPTLLVLDDLGLGFRSHENLWPDAIRSFETTAQSAPSDIVLKTNSFSKDNRLLKHLLDHHADCVTLVVAADDLRARGAAISKGLSWDRTIEETVREFETGLSSCDLARARRVVIHFDGGAGAASFTRLRLKLGPPHPAAHAAGLDEPVRDRGEDRPGKMFGSASIITAAVVRHIADPATYPIFIALGRGLTAVRHSREQGGGAVLKEQPGVDLNGIRWCLHWPPRSAVADEDKLTRKEWRELEKHEAGWPKTDPCDAYYTAFPHEVLTHPQWRQQRAAQSNLLRDAVGPDFEYYTAVAMDVVVRGPERGLLRSVPKARYGKYMTVDREEIERINALRGLIQTYRSTPTDKRPLSISVFGPPGSGKSFAIKQLAEAMFGPGQQTLEFNLSQFIDGGTAQLHGRKSARRDPTCVLGRVRLGRSAVAETFPGTHAGRGISRGVRSSSVRQGDFCFCGRHVLDVRGV